MIKAFATGQSEALATSLRDVVQFRLGQLWHTQVNRIESLECRGLHAPQPTAVRQMFHSVHSREKFYLLGTS